MANHSGSRDNSGTDIRGITNSDRDRESSSQQSAGSRQRSSKESRGSTHSSGSGSTRNSPHDERRGSEEMGPMHTNAGNTGFSSDQISPKTQNMPQTGPSASHSAGSKGSSGSSR